MNESCLICTSHITYEWVMSSYMWMRDVSNEWVMSHEWVMSRMNEFACLIWMWLMVMDPRYEWVMSHMNESCHIWMSHVTFEWVMSHMNESFTSHINGSCHIWMGHLTYEWAVLSHVYKTHTHGSSVCMGHVIYEGVISHMNKSSCLIWIRLTLKDPFPSMSMNDKTMSHIKKSCHTWMSCVTYTLKSHVTYELGMPHMNESSCPTWIKLTLIEPPPSTSMNEKICSGSSWGCMRVVRIHIQICIYIYIYICMCKYIVIFKYIYI